MEFWFLVIGIVVIYQGYPHVRIFFKRLGFRSKVKKNAAKKDIHCREPTASGSLAEDSERSVIFILKPRRRCLPLSCLT